MKRRFHITITSEKTGEQREFRPSYRQMIIIKRALQSYRSASTYLADRFTFWRPK